MDNIQTDEELFGTYFTNPSKMFTLDDIVDYVHKLKDLKDKLVLELFRIKELGYKELENVYEGRIVFYTI